jgi:hypothetical protein
LVEAQLEKQCRDSDSDSDWEKGKYNEMMEMMEMMEVWVKICVDMFCVSMSGEK